MMRSSVTLLVALALAHVTSSCATGTAERKAPERERQTAGNPPEVVMFEVNDEPREASETHLAALDNQPSEAPIGDVPDALSCSSGAGTKVIHRLNRFEYNNTVRDLLGVDGNPADAFPKDDFGDSFDNNARALSVSPLLTDGYLQAAEEIAAEVLVNGSPVQASIVACSQSQLGTEECSRLIATRHLTRAFRRPVLDQEVDVYLRLFEAVREEGASFWEGVAAMVEASLLSTNFLFRVEFDPESTEPHALTDYELASRLSYFLWSSMPDEALFARAASGDLNTEDALREEVDRMLDDPKAEAFLDAFVGRWLEVDDIAESNQPATDVFPEYTPELKQAMEYETRRFMSDVVFGELPYDQALTAGYTYVNADLAEHYGIDGDFGEDFEEVPLDDTERAGLLTQGSILTLTAAPNRTSPVRRGVYVLSNILCSTPPPPPPNVEGDLDGPIEADAGAPPPATLAARARQHAEDPACYSCHAIMDPIGFGLENFDAIGRFREEENGEPIPASGELLLGSEPTSFEGAEELSELLEGDARLSACAARKLFTFALGRVPGDSDADDECRIERLDEAFRAADYDFREMVKLVTLTDSFRGRFGEPGRDVDVPESNTAPTAMDAGTEEGE